MTYLCTLLNVNSKPKISPKFTTANREKKGGGEGFAYSSMD